MEYPSLLWQEGLVVDKRLFPVGTDGKRTPVVGDVSAETIHDLLPEDAFGASSRAFFRYPCGREEILARQQLLWQLMETGNLTGLEGLFEILDSFENLYHRWCSPTLSKTAYILLFPAVAEAFLSLADAFAAPWCVRVGYAGAVQDGFATLLQDERIVALRTALADFHASWSGGLRLHIEEGAAQAFSVQGGFRERLRQLFDEMGLAEHYPVTRARLAGGVVLDAFAAVYPDLLAHAERLYTTYGVLLTEELSMEDVLLYRMELVFCRDAVRYAKRLRENGYPLCLPKVSDKRCIHLRENRDVSLLGRELCGEEVVPNDVWLEGNCRFCYVTGANGGGKTTYLRAVGIAVLLFLTGCPVSAVSGELWCFRRLCTHFPSKEDFNDSGRFVDEVRRAGEIRQVADEDTVALFNETFSGTDEQKSETCSRELAEAMVDRGAFGLYVTHIHSLTHERIPTLAAVVDEQDENRRTYRIRRMDGTDSSFAEDILKKYRLHAEGLAARLQEKEREAHTCSASD